MASPTSARSKGFPNFFKVIMGSTSDTTLIIPPEFMRRFGHHLPNPVFLKLPTEKKLTEVELNHVNGQTLMSRGWPEFKRRLSLAHGHFLLFEFNWDSRLFNVRIFDTSAVEIMTYPLDLDDYPVKKSEKLPEIDSHDFATVTGTRRRLPRGAETSIAYQRAVAFASRELDPHKTPFFIRLMQKSYLSSRFSMRLPLSFAGPSLPRGKTNSGTIVTDDGREWCVKCMVSGTYVFLSVGWNSFVDENRLKVGDVCIFQVPANKSNKQPQQPAVWNVTIFRA